MAGMRQIVSPPVFTPLPYGLLSVVQPMSDTDPHWQQGVTYQTRCMAGMGSTTYDECIVVTGTGAPGGAGAPPAQPTKVSNVQVGLRGAQPFTVYAEFDCSPVGLQDAATAASDALARAESWQVERAFWSGQAAGQVVVYPRLVGALNVVDAQSVPLQSPVVTGGGPFKPARALGILEGLMADCYNGVGVVHIPQSILPVFAGPGPTANVFKQNAQLRTLNGNLVAVGAGYPGTAPFGAAPAAGTAWMYGTGAVAMWRQTTPRVLGPSESIDRSKNTMKMIAERTYVLGWDCCHFGVLVDLT